MFFEKFVKKVIKLHHTIDAVVIINGRYHLAPLDHLLQYVTELFFAVNVLPLKTPSQIRFHHNSGAYRGTEVDAVRCVEVANLICTLKGISSVGRKLVRFSPEVLNHLNLAKEDIAILAQDLDESISSNAGLFGI